MSEEFQVMLPRAFVQDTGAEINHTASRLQRIVKAWVDAAFQGRPGNTDNVLQAIDGMIGVLSGMREQIIFTRNREEKKVTALVADARD